MDCFKVKNEFKNANVSRTIRFTDKMFEELNQMAVDYGISFNYLVLQCCQYALDNQDTKAENEILKKF